MKALRWLEAACWTGGILLLATYGGMRGWYEYSRTDGIAAFDSARREQQLPSHPDVSPASPAAASTTDPVDMSTWSRHRISQYRQSLREARVPLAVLRIPSVALAVPVYEGTGELNLNRGAGWIEGTAHIGAPGNVGIAAHRDGFFRALQAVRVGDLLQLEQVTGTATYRIVSMQVTELSDVHVLYPTPTPTVTLVTCYPFYYVGAAPRRFVVRAELTTGGGAEKAARPERTLRSRKGP